MPGSQWQLDPVRAAFNIGVMNRWLDFNDTWLAAEWGHPSDNLGGILAVCDYISRQRIAHAEEPLLMRDVLQALIADVARNGEGLDGKPIGELRFPGGDLDLGASVKAGSKFKLSLLITALPLEGVVMSEPVLVREGRRGRARGPPPFFRRGRGTCAAAEQGLGIARDDQGQPRSSGTPRQGQAAAVPSPGRRSRQPHGDRPRHDLVRSLVRQAHS